MFISCEQPEELAKEIFWVAWQACGSPLGMGWLQNNPNADRESVWNNVVNAGDYAMSHKPANKPYADYVFGRMMKFGLEIEKDGIRIPIKPLDPDYQAWCVKYPTFASLIKAAMFNLGLNDDNS